MRCLLLLACLLLPLAACDSGPSLQDVPSLPRGTALPPPGVTMAPAR